MYLILFPSGVVLVCFVNGGVPVSEDIYPEPSAYEIGCLMFNSRCLINSKSFLVLYSKTYQLPVLCCLMIQFFHIFFLHSFFSQARSPFTLKIALLATKCNNGLKHVFVKSNVQALESK